MEALQQINNYKNIATYLEDGATVTLLETLAYKLQNNEYYLPLIGQFSAGKSKLMNRILGEDVLPTKRTETTAFLTYIYYGVTKSAELVYANGKRENVAWSDIKNLDYSHTKDSSPIAALEIHAPLDLLKKGLVLVDTPGLNTLVTEHVKMTEELLMQSQYIIYVMSSSPSETDVLLLQRINAMGIPMLFVRTHVDQINSAEENPTETLEKDKKSLESKLGMSIPYFPLCNEKTSPYFCDWEWSYNSLFSTLNGTISDNVKKVFEFGASNRLKTLHDNYISKLTERKNLISSASEKTIEEIEKQLNKVEFCRVKAENELNSKLEEIKQSGEGIKAEVSKHQAVLKDKLKDEFTNNIKNCDTSINIKDVFSKELSIAIDSLTENADELISKWAEISASEVKEKLESVRVELGDADLAFDSNFSLEVANSYAEKENALLDDFNSKLAMLKQMRDEDEKSLASVGVKKEQIEETLAQYESFISQQNDQVKTMIEGYQPQYKTTGGEWGEKLRTIGSIGDMAMLFIPAAGWAKIGSVCAKTAGQLKNGGKIAQALGGAMQTAAKTAKGMSKVDTVLDGTKILNKGLDVLKGGSNEKANGQAIQPQKKTSILDYFSLSHWLGKIGDMVDPEVTVLDTEYEKQYQALIDQEKYKLDQSINAQMAVRKQLGQIEDEKARIKIEQEIRDKEEAQMRESLEHEKQKLAEKKEQAIVNLTIENASSQFKEKLNNYSSQLMERANIQVDNILSNIINSAKDFATSQIESITQQLKEIKESKLKNEDTLKTQVAEIEQLISSIE